MQIWQVRLVSMVAISWQLRQFEHMNSAKIETYVIGLLRVSLQLLYLCALRVVYLSSTKNQYNSQNVRTTKTDVKRTSSVVISTDLSSSITYSGCWQMRQYVGEVAHLALPSDRLLGHSHLLYFTFSHLEMQDAIADAPSAYSQPPVSFGCIPPAPGVQCTSDHPHPPWTH